MADNPYQDFNAMELQRARAEALRKKKEALDQPTDPNGIDFSRPYEDETTAVYIPPPPPVKKLNPPTKGATVGRPYKLPPRKW